ncbi:ABC transporter permease [Thalassotalea ponticola]|uniref:ABC transporter permease n=1 Tax=Thalassotalea ponticola TaxID=1523392 RepID=UPI0025B2C83F|nr:FtsX-like permease family protein [Thalassotalea ponticola]MDN3651269.1 ABC transporter permease [Thalassotalea ponticola]
MTMPIWMRHSLRLFQHELKRGDLTIICAAIILAVATVFSLSGFSDQIRSALISKSNSFIAADRVLQSSREVDAKLLQEATQRGLNQAQILLFSSMIFAEDEMLLASVKAVSEGYPLRGELLIDQENGRQQQSQPPQGSVWVAPSLLEKMSLSVGDEIEIGVAKFVITGTVFQEPDTSFSVFTQGPRVLMNYQDVAKTQVIQPGSRLTYRYLFAGDNDDVKAFESWIKPQVLETQRWYDIKSQQSPLARALNRAEKYLALGSMLGIILASVAVSVAARRYGQRHQPMVAVFKAMGASMTHIRKLYLLHWTTLALFSIAVGLLLGALILALGLYFISDHLPYGLGDMTSYPFVVAIFTGLLCAFAFAITPMQQLIATPVLSVIRGFTSFDKRRSLIGNLPPLLAVFILLWLFSRDVILTLALMIGGVIATGIVVLLGRLLVSAGRKIGSQAGQSIHLAMANLKRRGKQNNVQLISFTVAIKLLLLMLVVRNDLLDEWQGQLPADTPNQFLVNVSQQQVTAVESFLRQNNMSASALYPIVRGRLKAINDETVQRASSKETQDGSDQGRQGIGRELSLTWHNQLPDENVIVQGAWFKPGDNRPQVSVESRVAERLELKLGDSIRFQIGAQEVDVTVTSIRDVNWQSMQPNFYMIFSDSVLTQFPATYIASIHVPDDKKRDMQTFLSQYPTISVIDVEAILLQLRDVISQVSLAVEFILILVLIAGALVLIAQVQASMEERERELAILRTLGARGALLKAATLLEFVILGAIAGLLASIGMEIAVYVVQQRVFDMQPNWHIEYWALGIVTGATFVGLMGLISCYRLMNLSSVTLIRRTL